LTSARQDAWKPWLAAILWLILIAIESTNLFSSENTSRFLYPLLTYLFGHIDPVRFSFWHHIGRKVGHVVGYAILSLLLFRAWKATFPSPLSRSWTWRWAQLAFFMTALVASLDEWHQTFLPSRTGSVRDVILDSTAALGAQLLLYLLLRGWRSQAALPPYA
jgi:VanZ family protein